MILVREEGFRRMELERLDCFIASSQSFLL